MKKLFLMMMVLLAAAACSRDEMAGPAMPGGQDAIEPPHFYGMATLDNEAPQTRGVANKMNVIRLCPKLPSKAVTISKVKH